MLNHVKFKDELLELLLRRGGLAVVNGKPERCHMLLCSICEFRKGDETCDETCKENRLNWLYSQHVEKPKLTQRERKLCEVIETGWISRDSSGVLFHYEEKPKKGEISGVWSYIGGITRLSENVFGCKFAFVKWEDEEPWAVEDLLKLEVQSSRAERRQND